MTEKELFNSYFKKNFKDLHKAICCGDLVAINYKKAMWKSWQASAKRDGFKLVPRKPTQQIYRAFYNAFNSANTGNTAQCFKVGYKAMLSAVEG